MPNILDLKSEFFNNLVNIGHEYRYGDALHKPENYHWLEGLFIKIMSNKTIYKLMKELESWDYNTYQHSLDTFILGSLYARALKIDDIEKFAIGCLLHDIGKLKIPNDILNKPCELSLNERELVKNIRVMAIIF
ncbi:HD-GYP domain-containing protein [Bacillus sp. N9]